MPSSVLDLFVIYLWNLGLCRQAIEIKTILFSKIAACAPFLLAIKNQSIDMSQVSPLIIVCFGARPRILKPNLFLWVFECLTKNILGLEMSKNDQYSNYIICFRGKNSKTDPLIQNITQM